MTKFVSVLFASLMALSLMACGGAAPSTDDAAGSQATTKKPLKKFTGGRMEAAEGDDE